MTTQKQWKKSPFYKQYGMSMAEMGKRLGISRECVRQRVIRGVDVTNPKKIVKKGKPKQLDLFSWYKKKIKDERLLELKILKKERKDPRVVLSGPYKGQWKVKKQIRKVV